MDYLAFVPYVFSAIIGVFAHLLWGEWSRFRETINSVNRVSAENGAEIGLAVDKVSALGDSVSKMAKDQSEFMNLVGMRVMELKNEVSELKNQIFVPSEPVYEPISDIRDVEDSYEATYKDLILQGLDPETAKYKAAEEELSKIADFGGISNLGFGE